MEIYSLDLLDCLISFAKRILSLQARTEFQVLETFEDAGQVRNSVCHHCYPLAIQHSYGMLLWKTTIFSTSITYKLTRGYIYIYIYMVLHGRSTWPIGFPPASMEGASWNGIRMRKPCAPSSKIMQAFCGFGCLVTP